METYSTELVSDIYSGILCEEQETSNKSKDYDVRECNGGAAEVSNIGLVYSKRNISNAKAQLSAQVMNLPYDDFCESIPIETSRISKTYDDYDIFKRIKEAYAACTCKICKCVAGNTIAPRAEFCDCEPCKCKDCTSIKDNIKRDSINFKSLFKNKSHDKLDYKNKKDREICNCKPCDCIQCSKRHSYYDRRLKESDMKVTANANNTFVIPSVIYDGQREKILFNMNRCSDCKCKIVLNETYKPNEIIYYPGIIKDLTKGKNNDVKIHNNSIKDKRPIIRFPTFSNKKCLCNICECLTCESKRMDKDNRWLQNMKRKQDFNQTNLKSYRCLRSGCEFNSHKNEIVSMNSQDHSKCMCRVCDCLQCEGDSVLNRGQSATNKLKIDKPMVFNTSCKCKTCECKDRELRMSKLQISCSSYDECRHCQRENSIDKFEISKTLALSKIRDNPVISNPIFQSMPNQCRACSEITLSKQNSKIFTFDKLKHGNVVYVRNKDIYVSSNKMYEPQSTLMDTNPKQNTWNHQGIDNQVKEKKSAQFKHDVFSRTPRSNSPTKSTNTPATMPILTAIKFRTFSPGSRSTQTVSISSSILSCNTKGATCSITSPDTNSVGISTNTTSNIPNCQFEQRKFYSRPQYEYQRNIFRCTGLKTTLNAIKTDGNEYIQDTTDTEESLVESLLSDPFTKYLLKSCNDEQSTKSTHENFRLILHKAKELTLNMNTMLQKYEKANSQFESLSKRLKKSQQKIVTEKKNLTCKEYETFLSMENNKKGKIIFVEDIEFDKNGLVSSYHNKKDPNDPIKINVHNISSTNKYKSDMLLNQVHEHDCLHCNRGLFRSVNSFQSIQNVGTVVEKIIDTVYKPNTYSISDSEDVKTGKIKFTTTINKPIPINKSSQTKQNNMTEIAKRARDELHNNVYNNNFGLLLSERQKCINKKMDSLRTRKIRDILKQNSQSDIFTERVPSSRTMSLMDIMGNHTFNHHTNTLMISTESLFKKHKNVYVPITS